MDGTLAICVVGDCDHADDSSVVRVDMNFLELVLLVTINAFIDTVIVLVLQKRSFNTQLQNIWNMKVELTDLNGEVIKVPVTKIVKNKEGEELEQTDMIVAPLWYTILYGAGTMAAQQVKMSILSAKGKISRELNTCGFALLLFPSCR